jgi:hypothetical protein
MTDLCERDLVKRRLEIDASNTTYDDKIDECVDEASAIVQNALDIHGGVPNPIPDIIQHACADVAAALFKRGLDPTAKQPLYDSGMEKVKQYIDAHKRGDIPFYAAEATS